ncbi:MAG: 3,4-dihydroxy 2-butanone 4-phosphate synthase / cyclohydrolase [Solirubrobacteraceae bacterium]|nr:3,4-dihydroxy 2-butanone 4-phosphate synthase / cyclohydrolase [Solirubrobacteraceae bacterium]
MLGTGVSEVEFELSSIDDAVAAMRRGEIVIVVDAPTRENEGDLVMAAECATPETINFMATHGRGLICVPMLRERLEALRIPKMVADGTDPRETAFHVGVDHRRGTTTGISASDRATTIRALASGDASPGDFSQPGHVFPLCYQEGGVLRRAGHTEAGIDLAVLADRGAAAVICEVIGEDGEMARLPALLELAREHGLLVVSIADLIAYRRSRERLVVRMSEARLPLASAEFRAITYRDTVEGHDHLVLQLGDVAGGGDVLVRMHSECLTGDVFGSERCDCGRQLQLALDTIAAEGRGVVVYLRGHEGRGIGLGHKLRAYSLQDQGRDTVEANLELGFPADSREYGIGAQILVDLGVTTMRLMTNNPAKYGGIEGYGLEIIERVPMRTVPNEENIAYLRAKQSKLGHLLGLGPKNDPNSDVDEELGGS